MIVDAHHHLWDPARREYPWMTGPFARLRQRFGIDELRAVTSATATIAVQAAMTEEETLELLRAPAPVRGVVGWVDLTAPDVADRIAALVERGPGRLVGIRHQVQDEPDPAGWLAREDVRRGLRAVAAAGLVYDLLVLAPHLPAAGGLAGALPELSLVLDHAAKPPIAGAEWEPWSSDLENLARHQNVTVKLSGLVTEAPWDGWREAGTARYARRVVDAFGPERTMWGSDWPVCTLAATYEEVRQLAEDVLAPGEREAVLGATATRVYGL